MFFFSNYDYGLNLISTFIGNKKLDIYSLVTYKNIEIYYYHNSFKFEPYIVSKKFFIKKIN